jgi:predicted RNase H-like nuclease (RuvC/YqgF family)
VKPNSTPKSIKTHKPPLPVDPADLSRLESENAKLVKQLLDFNSQMESRLSILHERKKSETIEEQAAIYSDPELKQMMEALGTKSKKIKKLQDAIQEMYKRLESSYKVDRIVELENKMVECERKNQELENDIRDLIKVKKEQKVFYLFKL